MAALGGKLPLPVGGNPMAGYSSLLPCPPFARLALSISLKTNPRTMNPVIMMNPFIRPMTDPNSKTPKMKSASVAMTVRNPITSHPYHEKGTRYATNVRNGSKADIGSHTRRLA
jgi:hypothetical protein